MLAERNLSLSENRELAHWYELVLLARGALGVKCRRMLVGARGFEPGASCAQGRTQYTILSILKLSP